MEHMPIRLHPPVCEKLSEQAGIPAVSYKDVPALACKKTSSIRAGCVPAALQGLQKICGMFPSKRGKGCSFSS